MLGICAAGRSKIQSNQTSGRKSARGAAVHRRRLPLGGGSRPREIFRCARLSPALSAGETPAPERDEPPQLSSWVGVCPGDDESAGVSHSHRSPKGSRHMRRILNQAANAAVMAKGSIFEIVYRRLVPRLGHNQAIGAIAHRLCRLIWMILHQGVRYEERGPEVNQRAKRKRTVRMIRELRNLGYQVEAASQLSSPA
jgi:hypothetical protein